MKLDINLRPQQQQFTITHSEDRFTCYLSKMLGMNYFATDKLLYIEITKLPSILISNYAWYLMFQEIGVDTMFETYDKEDIFQAHDDLTNELIDDISKTFNIVIDKLPSYRD